ncbi:hypothetical protein FRC00_001728 [Tulasnella sp. 408]|nr:hypothetical protein FRC00_001728 [Tulasnella sp. 408]
MSSAIMLSPADHTKWKHHISSTALSLGAFSILKGSKEPYPGTTDSDEKKENRDWKKAGEKIAGAIYATLDEAHQAIVADVEPTDAKALWDRLNGQYEKKDIGGRFFAMQNLMAISYRDAEHPTESLLEFGNRVVDGSKKLQNLIPDEPKYEKEKVTTPATATCVSNGSHKVNVVQATFSPSTYTPGFTASVKVLWL